MKTSNVVYLSQRKAKGLSSTIKSKSRSEPIKPDAMAVRIGGEWRTNFA